MSEEKRPKEVPGAPEKNIGREGKEAKPEAKPVENPPAQTPPDAVKTEGAAEKKKEAEKQEKPAECISCNKNIKDKWYYREGKYYCTKSCWKKAKKKAAGDKEKAEGKK